MYPKRRLLGYSVAGQFRGPPKKPRFHELNPIRKPRYLPMTMPVPNLAASAVAAAAAAAGSASAAAAAARTSGGRLSLDAFPHDVLPRIVNFLPLADIQKLRLLGLGSAAPDLHAQLSAVMRRHVKALQHVWVKMDTADLAAMFSGTIASFEPRECDRVLRALQCRRKVYPTATPSVLSGPHSTRNNDGGRGGRVGRGRGMGADAVAGVVPGIFRGGESHANALAGVSGSNGTSRAAGSVPPHLCEWPLSPVAFSRMDFVSARGIDSKMACVLLRDMPGLRRLHIARKVQVDPPRVLLHPVHVLRCLPIELGRAEALQELEISNHRIDCVPGPVLRMRRLRKLVIDQNAQLTELPVDIGARLPRLRCFSAELCALYTVPQSLLQTLERNYCEYDEVAGEFGLFVTGIPKDYLKALIPKDEFPHLHRQVGRRQKW